VDRGPQTALRLLHGSSLGKQGLSPCRILVLLVEEELSATRLRGFGMEEGKGIEWDVEKGG